MLMVLAKYVCRQSCSHDCKNQEKAKAGWGKEKQKAGWGKEKTKSAAPGLPAWSPTALLPRLEPSIRGSTTPYRE